jgi:hypothetical protein
MTISDALNIGQPFNIHTAIFPHVSLPTLEVSNASNSPKSKRAIKTYLSP